MFSVGGGRVVMNGRVNLAMWSGLEVDRVVLSESPPAINDCASG